MGRAKPADSKLVSLARKRFGDDWSDRHPAELKVATKAAKGEEADFGRDDPACGGEAWPLERTLRADFLRWLLASAEARAHIDFRGATIYGARVEGVLELRGAEIDARAILHMCALDYVHLQDARVRSLSLGGSRCAGIDAQRLNVRGALFLHTVENRRFCTSGTVNLTGATIEGELNCTGAHLTMTDGGAPHLGALALVGAEIGESAYFDGEFEARGKVVLRGARIGGSLECSGGSFFSAEGSALEADAVEVAHSVVLDRGFRAEGSVDLTDAEVGHNLKCTGGSFVSHEDVALNGSRLRVAGGAAFGGSNTSVVGKLVLSDAKIGGSLELKGSGAAPRVELYRAHIGTDVLVEDVQFAAVGHTGLIATDAKVAGELRWRAVKVSRGTRLDLRGAEVRTLADGLQDWPEGVGFEPLYGGLTYRRIEPASKTAEEVKRRVKWLGQERAFNPQPYNQLAAALRASGHEGRSVAVAIAREDDRRTRGGLSPGGKTWSWILKLVLGSGYRPYLALVWSLLFIVAGALIFGFAESDGHFVETTGSGRPPFHPFVYSLDTFLPITDLQQERFRAPGGEGIWASVVQVYFWLHVLFGWILVTLGILGVTGLVRRE